MKIENPNIVQIKSPRTQTWVKISQLCGEIITSGKKKPYKNIPIMSKTKKGKYIYKMP